MRQAGRPPGLLHQVGVRADGDRIQNIVVIRHSKMRTLSKIEYFGSLLGVYPIFKYLKNIWKDLRK
jgi:hypothetical protein